MATKEEVLNYIKVLAEQKVLTKEELVSAYESGTQSDGRDRSLAKKLGIAEILYFIGGAIVFLGIAIFLAQNWSVLGFGAKILSTLGAGIAAYTVGILFNRDERTETVGLAFFLISALVLPIGLFILFDNAGFDAENYAFQSLISAILLATHLLSYFVFRKNIFILFSIIFSTWLFFSVTSFLIDGGPYFDSMKFYEYRVLLTGAAYILIGYAFSKTDRSPLCGFLYGFGILGFLGAALSLGGWSPSQNVFWELIYPGLALGTIFLSVHLKSKAFLVWGTLFLMIYILKITSEYFSEGLGWPLALVIAGLAMIGVGYMSFSIRRKYLATP
jgi:hypothetical protein